MDSTESEKGMKSSNEVGGLFLLIAQTKVAALESDFSNQISNHSQPRKKSKLVKI